MRVQRMLALCGKNACLMYWIAPSDTAEVAGARK